MKVLQLTVHFAPNVGGVETHLTDLVTALVKRKIQTVVLAYRPLAVKAPWKMLEKSSFLTIIRLPWFPGLFYKLLHNPALEFAYLTPGLFLATPFVVLKERCDVIQAHGIIAGFAGVFWGKILRKRVIVTTHSLYHFPKNGMYRKFVQWIFAQADEVLCLSRQSVEEILHLGVEREKVQQFTYWVDTQVFKPLGKEEKRKQLKLPNVFTVFFVGRLVEEKGIKELIKAARLVRNIAIVIAGTGPLEKEVIEASKKNQQIQFVGRINNKDLPSYYAASDVVIIPSVHEEGFGRVILESLSCGTPVIGSNRGAIPDAMDKTVGELIDITPKNIATTLTSLQKNKNRLTTMAKKAREFALKRYSDKNLEPIISAYTA